MKPVDYDIEFVIFPIVGRYGQGNNIWAAVTEKENKNIVGVGTSKEEAKKDLFEKINQEKQNDIIHTTI